MSIYMISSYILEQYQLTSNSDALITASTIREIHTETGLTISNLRTHGVTEWEVPEKTVNIVRQDHTPNLKYIVFLFRTSSYTGELKSSAERQMEWMTLDEIRRRNLAPHIAQYIRVLQEDNVPQTYGISRKDLTIIGG